MNWRDLPVLGIGMASDVSGILPNFREFLDKEPKISYLNFGAHYSQLDRLKYYIDDLVSSSFDLVFHPVNLNLSLNTSEAKYLIDSIVEIIDYTKPKWAGQDIALWNFNNQYLGPYLIPPILDERSVDDVSEKVLYLNEVFDCPFLIENPPVCFSLENMHMIEFIAKVVQNTDCGLVLDVGHLIGYQQATGRNLDDMPLEIFPFDHVVEIHLAGLQFSQIGEELNIIDQHAYPVHDSCWSFLSDNISKMSNLKGITMEQEFCKTELAKSNLTKAINLFSNKFVNYA